jgi:hypothetical protein
MDHSLERASIAGVHAIASKQRPYVPYVVYIATAFLASFVHATFGKEKLTAWRQMLVIRFLFIWAASLCLCCFDTQWPSTVLRVQHPLVRE